MSNITKIQKKLENPTVRNILLLLGVDTFVAASLVIPALPMASKPIIDLYKKKQREKDLREWNRFNRYRLRQNFSRLYQQKVIEISEVNGETSIKLTDKGKSKLLKYKLEEIMITKPPKWDKKWRLIAYDIGKEKKLLSEIFRKFLQKLEFLKLQKSLYITPYPCEEQIEFLKQYYGLDENIIYIVVEKIENDKIYKEYFGF